MDGRTGNARLAEGAPWFQRTYLYQPADFLPEERDGFFGRLDDAYVVGSIYFRTMTHRGPQGVRRLPHAEDLSRQLPHWLHATEQILPAETRKIETLLDELSRGNPASFNRMMEQQGRRAS